LWKQQWTNQGTSPAEAAASPEAYTNYALSSVTTQDFINFWGKIFVFVLLEMIENSQRFKTF
jgi:hypothetical protein